MQRLTSQHDIEIAIDQTLRDGTLEVRIAPNRPTDTVLHWGATRKNSNTWHRPPRGWPDGSEAFGEGAVRTSLHGHSEAKPVVMRFDEDAGFTHLAFVLHDPGRDAWDDNGGRNYQVPLQSAQPDRPPLQAARELASAAAEEVLSEFESPMGDATLAVVVAKHGPEGARLAIVTDQPGDLWLHWGVAPDRHQRWSVPPEALLPSNTKVVSDAAVRSPFAYHKGLQSLAVEIPDASSMMGLSFVLYDAQANRWFKRKGGDFFVRLSADPSGTEALDGLAQTIVDHEMNRGSWTLMHRYNLAHGLIEDLAPGDREGLGLAYVWLRYSALRQLDWQRNYNTKPRELAHAQDRLTRLLARRYTQDAAVRDIVRWILPTIGRGGEGQRVRDEILEIMHRHHIKEVAGRFMEQWHQKLHNNTTYDDVVICKAYLAFLLGNGDKEAFYGTLEANGVTRERLQGFERPITEEPDFVPHLRDGLLHDFNSFLRTLKSVHDGLDLESALHTANHALGDLQEHAWSVWKQRRSDDVLGLARSITLLRERLSSRLLDERVARDLLSLDVALENQLRVVLERSSSVRQDEQALAKLIPLILRNLALSWSGDEELALCVRQWEKLEGQADAGTLGALRTQAAVDRTARALVDHVDGVYAQLQPKAELLGRAFGADSWTVELFSEEAVRGRLEFVVGMLLRRLDALLRRRAGIQGCRVVSRGLGAARGRVLVEKDLRALQGKAIDGPVVVICDHVSGDEELPASVAAVLTADGVDLVSHVAVRARNSGLVMVTVYDEAQLALFRELRDRQIGLRLTAAGDIVRDDEAGATRPERAARAALQTTVAPFSAFVVPLHAVNSSLAGGKSNQLRRLQKNKAPGIRIPRSMVIPYSVYDVVAAHAANAGVRRALSETSFALQDCPGDQVALIAEQLRHKVMQLEPADGMLSALRHMAQECGLAWPEDRQAWTCIKRVWASKWTDRAVWNRRTQGMPHDALHMAVLIQEVARADYSFVLHTVDPSSEEPNQGYGEVVLGLGETLVGNHPGRALGFSWNKTSGESRVTSMPSKRRALYGGGLMFRSDSNGEDLAEHAGAGLYDSVQFPEPEMRPVDYSREPLVWDDAFRAKVMGELGRIGQALEESLGGPQDVEGAYGDGGFVVVQSRPQVGS